MKKSVATRHLQVSSLLCATVATGIAIAQPGAAPVASAGTPPTVEEVVVFGRNSNLLGIANAASQGSISGADLLMRPMLKPAELLESMPGMVAVQHSGSGKANQYFLRGFNLDHGTDYSVHIDGLPLNLRSHGHGQGYLDINGLIPETVESIDYRKGPYRADLGDFSVAGASFISTIDALDQSFLAADAGERGWRRYAGGGSHAVAGGTLTLTGEVKNYDGPWESPEDLAHVSVWGKYLVDTGFGQAAVTLSGYDAKWHPTEQIPERALGTVACEDEFCALDTTADGSTERWMLTGNLTGNAWEASVYAQHYDWLMQSNPTYDYQINQFDERWTVGGKFSTRWIDNARLSVTTGADFRYDDAGSVGLDHFERGSFIESISDNEIKEGSLGLHVDYTLHINESLRLLSGLRLDYYDFDVAANNANSFAGQKTDSRLSPKLGVAWAATETLELYGNWGRGFHSNDARGVVNALDPVEGLSPAKGYEAGARTSIRDIKVTAAYWWLDQKSELVFVGDSNSVEAKGGSRRKGAEFTLFWQPSEWLGIDAVYTASDAQYVDDSEGSHVEGAIEESAQFGLSATRDVWDASLRVRYLGPYALLADNSDRADSLLSVNLRAARHWKALTVYAEIINLLDTNRKEIVYNYPAYVPGLDPVGTTSEDIDCSLTNCRVSRVTEPRTFRAGISLKF
ncbi:MAG: TonB-dependent receptor [Gammaproteobacteria bacterium]|nr:TonB-dependent receptor [Gammaproteobacteria bacterium]